MRNTGLNRNDSITVPIFLFTLFSNLFFSPSTFFHLIMRPLPKALVDNAIVMLRNGSSARATAKAFRISISSEIRIQRQQKENIPPVQNGGPKLLLQLTSSGSESHFSP